MLLDINNLNPHESAQSSRPEPVYSTKDSAGFDIPAGDDSEVPAGGVKVIKTKLYLKQPKVLSFWWLVRKALKFFGIVPMLEIRSRSGLSVKGITVNNAPGTVDADFPEEIGVILRNQTDKPFAIKRGDRIAQGLVTLSFRAGGDVAVKKVERKSGFGSTGK